VVNKDAHINALCSVHIASFAVEILPFFSDFRVFWVTERTGGRLQPFMDARESTLVCIGYRIVGVACTAGLLPCS